MKVKVKIAVVVRPDGLWAATGYTYMNDDTAFGEIVADADKGEARYWLTAELDTPEVSEVAAQVEKA